MSEPLTLIDYVGMGLHVLVWFFIIGMFLTILSILRGDI